MASRVGPALALAVFLCGVLTVLAHDLDCDFNDGLCYWSNVEGDGWRIQEGEDGLLVFKPTWGTEVTVATLQSPMMEAPPSANFRFNYWLVSNGDGGLRIRVHYFLADETLAEEKVVFERKKSSQGRRDAVVPVDNSGGFFKILVDAVKGDGFYGVIHLNDFRFELECDESWCQNGGTCVKSDEETVECRCPPGFGGRFCEQYRSRHPLCSGVEVMVSAWPESYTPYSTDRFGVKCLVYTTMQPDEKSMCSDGTDGIETTFRAVTSIVIKKENKTTGEKTPVAMVSTYDSPTSYLEEGKVDPVGKVSLVEKGMDSELAYLNIDWFDHDQSEAGVYVCQVNGLDTLGQSTPGEVRAEVVLIPETMDSLRDRIKELEQEVERLEAEGSCEPVQPTEPTEPTQPTGPTEPIDPVKPVEPVEA